MTPSGCGVSDCGSGVAEGAGETVEASIDFRSEVDVLNCELAESSGLVVAGAGVGVGLTAGAGFSTCFFLTRSIRFLTKSPDISILESLLSRCARSRSILEAMLALTTHSI